MRQSAEAAAGAPGCSRLPKLRPSQATNLPSMCIMQNIHVYNYIYMYREIIFAYIYIYNVYTYLCMYTYIHMYLLLFGTFEHVEGISVWIM